MISAQGLQLAEAVTKNDASGVTPLIKLLHGFRTAHGDPLSEAMMADVINWLYTKTEHCEAAILQFIKETEEAETSLAA